MKKYLSKILLLVGSAALTVCVSQNVKAAGFPEILENRTFVCDELETGEGTALYTLDLSESGYRLYQDGGTGIISEGRAELSEGRTIVFSEGTGSSAETFTGTYSGSAFEEPSVTLQFGGETLDFVPASETEEYVYLSYLGVFEGRLEGMQAVLILERWKEFYLYSDGSLMRGTYEIYEDGSIALNSLDQEEIIGEIKKTDGEFDLRNVTLCLGGGEFTYADAVQSWEAEHAMGAYTLSLYAENVFLIRGIDGFVKALGTLSAAGKNGQAAYFPRSITGEVETGDGYTVDYTVNGDEIIFPSTTPLLPRSGNIDADTGYGSYWKAGTTLEFLESTEDSGEYPITYEPQDTEGKEAPICDAAKEDGELKQAMPSLGTAKPLVLLIDFPDCKRPRFVTAEGMQDALFDLENQDSLSAYYYRSSYGNLTIDGTVLGWYRARKNRDEYETDTELMEEAIRHYIAEENLKLSDYDADGDGNVDSLYVLWAGNLNSDGGIWSAAYRSSWEDSPEEWDARVSGYIFVPGNTVWSSVPPLVCNLNSLTHETGHLLGLNDYYSYDTDDRSEGDTAYTGGALEGGLGGMDMMDANIADHNAFSKWLLGWLEPEVVEYGEISSLQEQERTFTLRPSNERGDALFIKLEDSESWNCEMLVVEVISSTMNNSELTRLKEPAVRILHVDASLDEDGLTGNWRGFGFQFDNSYTSTKFISLLEADGKDEILNYLPGTSGNRISYDVGDCFGEGSRIAPDTWPNTNAYDIYGNATVYTGLSICVESIAEDGTAQIRLAYEEAPETLQMVSVTPEPTVVPYRESEMTEIQAETTEICLTFDQEITEADDGALETITVVSGNQELDGWHSVTEGNTLKIQFDSPLEGNRGYTLIVPEGILRGAGDSAAVNRYNSIYGFLTQ